MNAGAEKIIAELGLEPLPQDGGYFRPAWVSEARLASGRAAGSAIWFLLTPESFSAWHRLQAEELWHFYAGDPVEHALIEPVSGALRVTMLGSGVTAGQRPQLPVPGGAWQAARLKAGRTPAGWALLGCTVTPAWDEREFELGGRAELLQAFPAAAEWIRALTR